MAKLISKNNFVKKLFLTFTLCLTMAIPAMAQNAEAKKPIWDHGNNTSDITYQSVEIYKILETKDAYVILYAQSGVKVGETTVPKSWAKLEPRKLEVRELPVGLNPYMTVIKQNGEFLKVWFTIPSNKRHSVWGVLPNGTTLSDLDKETLEIKY